MHATLALVVPFFGLIVLGYAVGRLLALPREGTAALDGLVRYVALPVLFFSLLAETPTEQFAGWPFLAATAFSTYCAFAIAFSIAALLNRGNVSEATVQGLTGSWSNTALLAPGLTLAMFGPLAAAPTAFVFCLDAIILIAVTPAMMALGGADHRRPGEMVSAVARRIATEPIIVATVLGLAAAYTGFSWPEPVDAFFALVRGSAAPAGLFAAGAVLATVRPLGVPRELPYLAAVKLIIHPTIVYVLLGWVGDFSPVWVYSAVLIAALPSAPEVIATARSYNALDGRAGQLVLAITALSVVTLTALVYLIGNRILPADLFP